VTWESQSTCKSGRPTELNLQPYATKQESRVVASTQGNRTMKCDIKAPVTRSGKRALIDDGVSLFVCRSCTCKA